MALRVMLNLSKPKSLGNEELWERSAMDSL